MYGDGDMISSSEGILFECSSGLKVITISEDMSLDALRKTIMDLFTSTCLLRVKGPIELHAMFDWSPDKILVLLCKTRKPRSVDDIITLMCDKSL
ncbi:hypothetical protein GmHk_14G040802 [Glycine max]|nr:hypothetical protein GmHk_14G040802 [Glycine max]